MFLFRLALALGMTVRELEARMGSDEVTEWLAYYKIDPFGSDRDDWRAGMIASTVANCHITRGPSLKPRDFMLDPPDVQIHPVSGERITQAEWDRIQEENQIAAWQRLIGSPPTSPAP